MKGLCDNCKEEKEIYCIDYHQTCIECYEELIHLKPVIIKTYE